MEIGRRMPKDIQETQRENNKSTSCFSTKKRRKIQNRNKCFRSCYRIGAILGTRWKVETDSIPIKNDTTCRKKLQNLWQRVTGNSKSSDQVETIFTRHIGNIWNMDRPWKLEVFPRTSQVK